jgi:hypothetical protein
MKVYDDYEFIIAARLEEGVLDVREGDVDVVALLGDKADSVLVDLEMPRGLLAHDVRTDDQVLQDFLLTLDKLEVFHMPIIGSAVLSLRALSSSLLVFDLLQQVLDVLRCCDQVILPVDFGRLIL